LEAAFSPAAAVTPTLSVSVVAVVVAVRARTAGRARLSGAAGGVVELVALGILSTSETAEKIEQKIRGKD
jgi:hypothetical protein